MNKFKILGILFLVLVLNVARGDVYTASRACVRVSCSDGVGSGIVVGSDNKYYYAITNAHVATKEKAVIEFFDAGKVTRADAVLVQRDAALDLAVYKVDTKGYNPAIIPVDPNYTMKAGDVLCTIGHPLGKYPTCFFCTYKTNDPVFGLMFTPPPAQGRSGSPLLAPDGSRVVGIVYGYTTQDMVGLAIPAKVVASFLNGAVEGTPKKTKWTPPRDGVVRFTAMHSILESTESEEETGEEEVSVLLFPESGDPMTADDMVYTTSPQRIPGMLPRRALRGNQNQGERPRFFRRFRKPNLQQQEPLEYPPMPEQKPEPTKKVKATKVKIEIGEIGIGVGGGDESKPAKPSPVPPPPAPAPPVPHGPHPPRPLPPHPAPGFFPPGPPALLLPPHYGSLAKTGAVVLTSAKPEGEKPVPEPPAPQLPVQKPPTNQANVPAVILTQYFYPNPTCPTCPNGQCPTCPTCPNGQCPTFPNGQYQVPQATIPNVVTPQKPVPAQIVGQGSNDLSDLIPDVDTTLTKEPEKKAVSKPAKPATEEKEPGVMYTQFLRSMDSAQGKIQTLEGRVSRLEADNENLRKDVEKLESDRQVSNFGHVEGTENAGLMRGRIPEAVENGLTCAGRALGEAVTLEVGEDVKNTLTTVNESVTASTAALTEAATSFKGTMTVTQETLAAVQECTHAIWVTLSVLVGVLAAYIIVRGVKLFMTEN